MRATTSFAVSLLLVASFAACGDDDGSDVRDVGIGCERGSGSGSEGGSGGGAASGSGTGQESCEPQCVPFGDADAADTAVKVTLEEWNVTTSAERAPAGRVHFAISNRGKAAHEFVVVEADDADALPRSADGGLDAAQLPPGSVIGEVAPFPAGQTCDATFDLAAGTYQLLCDRVVEHEGTPQAHLARGMVTTFTVT